MIKNNKLIEILLNKSGKEKITIVILIGVLLLIIALPQGGTFDDAQSDKTGVHVSDSGTQTGSEGRDYEEYIEKKLVNALSSVDGVGEVRVAVTIKTTGENVLAKDQEYSSSSLNETDDGGGVRKQDGESKKESYIYIDAGDGESPYVIRQDMPKVEGVIVVAKGGGDGSVAAEITAAVEALLDVPAHKIKVLKMS